MQQASSAFQRGNHHNLLGGLGTRDCFDMDVVQAHWEASIDQGPITSMPLRVAMISETSRIWRVCNLSSMQFVLDFPASNPMLQQ
jgi:hypothetical protein